MKLDRRHIHPNDTMSKFERWVREAGGPGAVSKKLNVHNVTVSTWLCRRATPTAPLCASIIELAAGELTLNDIIEGTRAW